MMRMKRGAALVLLAFVGAQIAGCHKAPEQPPENRAEAPEPPAPAPVVPPPAPLPKPVEPPRPAPPKAAAAPEISPDQQVQDDAAATGMTSRVPADSGGASSDNSAPQ